MAQSDYVRSLDKALKASYFDKLKQLGFIKEEDDPFIEENPRSKGHLKKWSTSLDSWPTVEFGDIYVYLIDCPGYTPKSLKAYKSLDAYNTFVNGWVHQLNIRQSHAGHCIIRASVNRTHNVSDGSHKAWVGFKTEDGSIISGHCTCMTGSAAICIHAVAIMFQVEAAPRLCGTGKICTVCHCANEEVLEQQEHGSSLSAEDASVMEFKSVDVKPQEEFDHDISILPETIDNTAKIETNCEEADSKELTYIQCEGVEPGMIIILSAEGDDGQGVINQQLNESHMETHNEPVEMKSMQEAVIVSNVAKQESSTESDKITKASPVKRTRAQKGKFQCDVCESTFTTNLRLENHKKSQHKEEHLKVREEAEDTAVIETEGISKEEPMEGNENNVYSCVLCSLTFTTNFLLESHIEKEHNAKFVQLYEENEMELNGKGIHSFLCKHETTPESKVDSIPKEKPFKCQECGQDFKHRRYLFAHVKMHSSRDKSFQFTCHQCGKGFKLIPEFQAHLKEHGSEKRFPCGECDKTYASEFSLKEHRRTHTGERPFRCNDCGKSFTLSGTYRNHRRIHTTTKSFICDVCGKAFKVSGYLRVHRAKHYEEKPYNCKECGKAFSHGTNFRRHMRIHTGDKRYVCEVCGRRFTQSTTLHEHKRIHTGDKPYACEVCGRRFKQRSAFQTHQRIHTGDKPHACEVCGQRFIQSAALCAHKRIHTGEKPCKCKICDKAFNQSRGLQQHMAKHTSTAGRLSRGERFKCSVCEERFSYRGNLKVHMQLIHSKELETSKAIVPETDVIDRPYVCTLCGKSFVSWRYRDAHQKVHTGETPFKCTKCDKGFTGKIYLEYHERTHTGEKPFTCHVCEKRFSFSANLARHMRIHSGEKRYECSVCGKAFTQHNSLNQHLRTHTGEKPHKCELCSQAFCESRGLKKHKQRIHNSVH